MSVLRWAFLDLREPLFGVRMARLLQAQHFEYPLLRPKCSTGPVAYIRFSHLSICSVTYHNLYAFGMQTRVPFHDLMTSRFQLNY